MGRLARRFKKTMKHLIRTLTLATALSAIALARAEDPGFVDFGKLNPTGESQFVEVNIKSNLIAMVASLTKKSEPEVTDVILGLKGVRVNVLGLNEQNRDEMKKRVTDIREKLDKNGWERIVTAIEKNQDVGVFLKMKDAKAVEGLCVTVIEKKEVILVNIIGDLRPEKLAMVGERFNIDAIAKLHLPERPARESKPADDEKPKS